MEYSLKLTGHLMHCKKFQEKLGLAGFKQLFDYPVTLVNT